MNFRKRLWWRLAALAALSAITLNTGVSTAATIRLSTRVESAI